MKPEQIALLDPHYANMMEFAVSNPMRALHEATTDLNDLLSTRGETVACDAIGFEVSIFGHVKSLLTLAEDDSLIEAKVLPPHDSFTLEDGSSVPSQFLVVDAHNPGLSNAYIRGYFLLLGENPLESNDPQDILPYYVVAAREVTSKGTPAEELHHVESHIFCARTDGWPLDIDIVPQRISEPTPYEVMAAEMQGAVAKLTSDI